MTMRNYRETDSIVWHAQGLGGTTAAEVSQFQQKLVLH